MDKDKEYLDNLRHSAAHLLAAAVLEIWPDAKPTIGPPIDNGFYYDFEFSSPPSEDDLLKIESKMRELLPTWKEFVRTEVTPEEARTLFSDNQYKHELIQEITDRNEPLTIYSPCPLPKPYPLDPIPCFYDLCRGGHIENPAKELKAFKILSIAGAYWRGDENNQMLTRIYGTAFKTQSELDVYLEMLEEAKKRDHKKLGKELDLFSFSDLVGPGLPLFSPKGTIIRDELEGFVAKLNKESGYQRVWIPHITKPELYKVSGHWEKFGEDLFHVRGAHGEFVVKPMNCPHHTQIYASQPRSYKDLPLRFNETTTVYRDEQSGQLAGLARVRSITQDDGHVFFRPEQLEQEFDIVLNIQEKLLKAVGLNNYWISLSLRDPATPEKYLGDDSVWEEAESAMEKILKKKNIEYKPIIGEAAFYGPKMDLMAKDAIGREWQLSTVQLDMNMPGRFGLEYTDKDGSKKTPLMIHRAFMGATERFIAVLIEHFAGAFPVWLSPVQVRIIPVSEKFRDYSEKVLDQLKNAGVRAEIDDSDETLGKRIRNSETEKIPYILVVGEKEEKAETVNIRKRLSSVASAKEGEDKTQKEEKISEFVNQIQKEIKEKSL